MSGKWKKIEPISPDEAQKLALRLVTEEAKDEMEKSPLQVSDLVKMSVRSGVILRDDVPCAIVGIRYSGLTPLLWFLPLQGLRGHVRGFVRFMQSLAHDGPVWAEASDHKARLVRVGGGRPDGNFWRLK